MVVVAKCTILLSSAEAAPRLSEDSEGGVVLISLLVLRLAEVFFCSFQHSTSTSTSYFPFLFRYSLFVIR